MLFQLIQQLMKNVIKLVKLDSNETSDFLQQNSIITHRLKPKKKDDWDTQSLSNADKSALSTNELLSSISTKLNPKSITVSTSSKYSGIQTQNVEIKVSCLDQLVVPKFSLGCDYNTLDFEELRRKAIRKKIKNIVSYPLCAQNHKKICSDNNCTQKQKWKNKLMIEPRVLVETEKLKNYVLNSREQTVEDHQIDKDVTRSFPDRFLPKTKLTLYHACSQKMNIIQSLRTVLKMLKICDGDVAYVQGMNLYTGVIVSHIKQIQLSFLFVKQVMKYGNMRKMYIQNFKQMKESCNHLLHRHIKLLMNDLYEAFMEDGVSYQFFMPFYLSMFSCVVDYSMMHSVIDEFMTKGFLFLDKLMLSMLCYMKKQLLQSGHGEIICKLGASFIRSMQIPWDEVINLTQTFQLN